jgi:glycerophosphoryl diester phosphodiesterase
MRLTGDPRRINETDYADLADVDVGAGFHPRFAGERIPTLEQCLDAARNRVGLMIELKYFGYDPRLAVDCVRLVRERGMEEQVALMSLYAPGVLQLRDLAPDIRVGYLSMLTAGDVARLDVDFVGVPLSGASSAFMRAARRRGLPVYVWGVARSDRMVAVIERGAAGLITSAPETAMRLRAELLNLTPAELLLLRFRQVWEWAEEEPESEMVLTCPA